MQYTEAYMKKNSAVSS